MVIEPLEDTVVVVVDCCTGSVVLVVEVLLVVVVEGDTGLGAPIPAAPAPGLAPGAAGTHLVIVVVGATTVELGAVVVIGTVVGGIVVVDGITIGPLGAMPIKSSTIF